MGRRTTDAIPIRCVNVLRPLHCNAHCTLWYAFTSTSISSSHKSCSACVLTQKVCTTSENKNAKQRKKQKKLLLQHRPTKQLVTVTDGRLQCAHTIKLFLVFNNLRYYVQTSNAELRCEQIDISNGTFFQFDGIVPYSSASFSAVVVVR